MSNFIPNSFQTPNVYIDAVMPLLLPHEFVVLSYAVRRIYGFNKRQDRIALSQFTDGTVSGDGHNYDYGTGLSVGTVRKAIDVLIGFKLLIKVADNDTRRNEGALYELQLDQDAVDWDGLKLRAAKRSSNMVAKMEKVRNAKPAMPQTPLCGTVPPPLCGTVPPPLCGIATQNTV